MAPPRQAGDAHRKPAITQTAPPRLMMLGGASVICKEEIATFNEKRASALRRPRRAPLWAIDPVMAGLADRRRMAAAILNRAQPSTRERLELRREMPQSRRL
jgi:hypothetical protein